MAWQLDSDLENVGELFEGKKSMQKPQINLNGSDGMDLARQYHEAALALENAMRLMSPLVHGRDWQTLPESSFILARKEMADAIKVLDGVRADLEEVARSCAEQAR